MVNLKKNAAAGNATAIALASASLVFILVLLAAVVFLVFKVKQLDDSIESNSSGGDVGNIVSGKQQKKTVV